jgi:hypothetical protein
LLKGSFRESSGFSFDLRSLVSELRDGSEDDEAGGTFESRTETELRGLSSVALLGRVDMNRGSTKSLNGLDGAVEVAVDEETGSGAGGGRCGIICSDFFFRRFDLLSSCFDLPCLSRFSCFSLLLELTAAELEDEELFELRDDDEPDGHDFGIFKVGSFSSATFHGGPEFNFFRATFGWRFLLLLDALPTPAELLADASGRCFLDLLCRSPGCLSDCSEWRCSESRKRRSAQ